MRVRFGYVAMAVDLKNCSPSKTVTVANLSKLKDDDSRILKLKLTARENLNNTLRILKYNAASDISVYRLTSKLVPLATHSIASGWDYISDLKEEFEAVGEFIKSNDFRISSHPDHFTLLNSPREDVTISSINDLVYHRKVFDAMGLDEKAKMVIHIGGLYDDRASSKERFIDNFKNLDISLKNRITLENDDKIYTAEEVLGFCIKLNVPMVLDVHHDRCNRSSHDIGEYIGDIFSTWDGCGLPPKIHLSSPKDEKGIRDHADYIDPEDFLNFLRKAQKFGRDFDVMIEAKMKNLALHKLMEDLQRIPDIERVNGAEIRI